VAQWKSVGLITQRSVDRNHLLLPFLVRGERRQGGALRRTPRPRGAKAVIYRPGAIRRALPPRGAKAVIYRPGAIRRALPPRGAEAVIYRPGALRR
jgi:hypothetical protein